VAQLNGSSRIERIIEKPELPPSDYAVTGVYFYDQTVWTVLPDLKPSGRGELEITDVNNWYLERGLMEYDILEGYWGDAGESMDAYYAAHDFVRANGANRE
jgi:glucose-1-phosphate thymidylyltransferase